MNEEFQRRMDEATRHMRAGSLMEATAAIQRALGGQAQTGSAGTPRGTHDDVIDVEARVVPDGDAAGRIGDAPVGAAPDVGVGVGVGRPESLRAGSFRNECGTRDYKLFEPARADARPLPLVVMLHGCTQDPDDFARGTRMNALARAHGFLVLYPAQSQRANAQRCWNWFKHNHQARGKGEPGILAGMVRHVIATHDIDPARVYVAGLSAGGAMAAILGDAYPDLFAAVGVHSGLAAGSATDVPSAFAAMGGNATAPRRSPKAGATPPTIVFHGDADSTVHVVNGERVLASAGVSASDDARRGASPAGMPYTRRTWVGGQGAERAEQWTIHGAGHAWSGGDPSGTYTDPRGPDASAEMLRFFLAHPRA